ncbi:hypothetical protein F2Q70_00029138 [Brassica cretica]|uniref:Uncharacterized protein n=1 Tax=Brassica cretica TaxID=69181 RepID=A0A8S9FKS5_BRACR|nr:hypothetical protein F2Q70_00029138 [Brassica cretica]
MTGRSLVAEQSLRPKKLSSESLLSFFTLLHVSHSLALRIPSPASQNILHAMEILLLIFIHTLLSALFPVSPDLTEALLGKDKVNGVRPSLFRTNEYNIFVPGNLKNGRELASSVAHITNWSTGRGVGHHFVIGSCH